MPESTSVKPPGYPETRWQKIKGRVEANCRKKAGGDKERADACTYATMRRIASYIEARQERKRNLEGQERVKT